MSWKGKGRYRKGRRGRVRGKKRKRIKSYGASRGGTRM